MIYFYLYLFNVLNISSQPRNIGSKTQQTKLVNPQSQHINIMRKKKGKQGMNKGVEMHINMEKCCTKTMKHKLK